MTKCNWKGYAFLYDTHCTFSLLSFLLLNYNGISWDNDQISLIGDNCMDGCEGCPWGGHKDWEDITLKVINEWKNYDRYPIKCSPFYRKHTEFVDSILNQSS